MTLAIVNVLPDPVTPSSVWCAALAQPCCECVDGLAGWSPAGGNGLTNWNSDIGGSLWLQSRHGPVVETQVRTQRLTRRRTDASDPGRQVFDRPERGFLALGDDCRTAGGPTDGRVDNKAGAPCSHRWQVAERLPLARGSLSKQPASHRPAAT